MLDYFCLTFLSPHTPLFLPFLSTYSGSSMYGPGDSGKAPERRGSSRDRERDRGGDRGRDRGSDRGERRRSRSRDRR